MAQEPQNGGAMPATATGSNLEAFGTQEWGLLAAIALIWGSSFVLIEVLDSDTSCTPSAPCGHREGDCDSDKDCLSGLFCPPDKKGIERCQRKADSCAGKCSPSCPCGLGEGDCDWPAVMKAIDEIGFEGWGVAEVAGGGEERLAEIAKRMDRIFAS